MRELPQVDSRRCNGCGDCVVCCPDHCLEMAGKLPWLPRPGCCVSCTLCVLVCPTEAIGMQPLGGGTKKKSAHR